MNLGICGLPFGPLLLVSCGGRLAGLVTDLATAQLTPISLLGAGLYFLRIAEFMSLDELLELRLSFLLLALEPREHMSQFFCL